MSRSIVLGVDPGLANFGWALVELEPNGAERFVECGVMSTEKSQRKGNVLASDDNMRRARELHDGLLGVLRTVGKVYPCGDANIVAIAAEAMSFVRAASAAAKLAMSWGVLAAFSAYRDMPIVQASPQLIKKTMCGVATATKEDVQRAIAERFGTHPDAMFSHLRKTEREHAADALAAIVTCRDAEVIRVARRLAAGAA